MMGRNGRPSNEVIIMLIADIFAVVIFIMGCLSTNPNAVVRHAYVARQAEGHKLTQ